MKHMRRMICAGVWLLITITAGGQWKWDGEAGDSSWTTPANWYPDGVPGAGADVLLDNSRLDRDYLVRLPAGTNSIMLDSLILRPSPGRNIRLVIPSDNRAAPALSITGPGESLRIDSGGVFQNASGAGSGDPLQVSVWLRISNGGTYIHATPRANAKLIDRLSTAAGTSTGVFAFDVPGTSGYTVSLTGNTFGSLHFSAASAGGLKSYSGSGSSDLYIRGDLVVDAGAGLTSTLTANIRLDGHLRINGLLSLQPPTAGNSGRSLLLNGPQSGIFEGPNIQCQQYFREIVIGAGHQTLLRSNLNLPHGVQLLRVMENGTLSMGSNNIGGAGRVEVMAGARLHIGHPAGIRADGTDGNIRTAACQLHTGAGFIFDGDGDQLTGDGLPDTIATLGIDKPTGVLRLSRSTLVTSGLSLLRGRIMSSDSSLLEFTGDRVSHPPNRFGMKDGGWDSSFIDGPLRRKIAGNGTFGMPVGRDGIFAPLTLHRSGSGSIHCSVFYSNAPTPAADFMADPHIYKVNPSGFWTLKLENTGVDTLVYPELPWRCVADSLSRKRWLDSLRIVTRISATPEGWKMAGNQPTIRELGTSGNIMSNVTIGSSTLLTLGMTGAQTGLPLTGISLTARKTGKATRLEWETQGTSHSTRFIVERTNDRHRTDTAGTLTVTHTRNGDRFVLMDQTPWVGWNTYRVCAHESEDDSFRCSGTVAVLHTCAPGLQLFPVPVMDQLHWRLAEPPDPGWIRIINMQGIEVWRARCTTSREGTIDTHRWPPGNYTLQFPRNGSILSSAFLKR